MGRVLGEHGLIADRNYNVVETDWGTCSDSGWITSQLLYDCFKKFVETVKATKEKTALLLLDGHTSHTKNIDLIDYAREHHVRWSGAITTRGYSNYFN